MTVLDNPAQPAPSWAQLTAGGQCGSATGARATGESGLMIDGFPRQAAGPRFRFADANPTEAGRSYAQSLFAELPYMVGVLVRWELHLTEVEWDRLVTTGAALDVTGPGEFRVPFTLDVVASPPDRAGRAPDGVCADCWGTGYEIDSDATMTGVLGGLFVCFCTGLWV
jgi:hypothetical protein